MKTRKKHRPHHDRIPKPTAPARPYLGLHRRDHRPGDHLLRTLSAGHLGHRPGRLPHPGQRLAGYQRRHALTTDDAEAVGSALIGQDFSAAAKVFPSPPQFRRRQRRLLTLTKFRRQQPRPPQRGQALINGLNKIQSRHHPADRRNPESLAFDGVRLRTIHYANDNGIAFKLYQVTADGTRDTSMPLSKFQDAQGNLNDVALVDAFPQPATDAADKTRLKSPPISPPSSPATPSPARPRASIPTSASPTPASRPNASPTPAK